MKNYLKKILIIIVKIVQNWRYIHKFHYLHENFDRIFLYDTRCLNLEFYLSLKRLYLSYYMYIDAVLNKKTLHISRTIEIYNVSIMMKSIMINNKVIENLTMHNSEDIMYVYMISTFKVKYTKQNKWHKIRKN